MRCALDAAHFLLFHASIMSAPNTLTATEIARRIDSGELTAEAVIRAHLERIDKRDADVLAWLKSKPGYQTRVNQLLREAMSVANQRS